MLNAFPPCMGKGTVCRWAGALEGRQGGGGEQCDEMGENEAMSSALPTIHTYVSLPLIDNLNLVCLTVDS